LSQGDYEVFTVKIIEDEELSGIETIFVPAAGD